MEKILKKDRGITLIALVVTIIILLILAGVTIGFAMNGTSLFDKAKLATDKYNNSVDRENFELGKAENLIDIQSNRDTITLTQEQFKSLFSNPGNKLKDMPNTWEVGTEYCWESDNIKIYGQRFTGTITKNNKTTEVTTLLNDNSIMRIIDSGGDFVIRDNGARFSIYSTNISSLYSSTIFLENGKLFMETTSGDNRTNAGYDVWVLYNKE